VPDPTSVVVVGYRRAVPRTARTVGNTITAALGFLASQAATPVSTKRGQTHQRSPHKGVGPAIVAVGGKMECGSFRG
jgi:hypothetical protein